MINRRFLNFETYEEFLSKLPEIPQDSIVFVQSKPCIWTHGKEYVCRGGDASVNGGVLSFTDDGNDVVFTIEQDNADLILRDSNGNYSKATYVLGSVFTDTITSLRSKDNEIISALNGKLGIDALTEYSKTSIIQGWLNNKQDKLTAGTGIAINQSTNTIYSTLDTEPYVIVQELPVEGNPNKIYLLETSTYQGVPKFELWKYRINNNYNTFPIVLTDGQSEYVSGSWVQLGDVDLGVNLSLYAKREQLDALWDELTTKYATIQYVDNNYVTKVYADGTYIKQSDVYTPAQEGGVSGIIEDESQGGSSGSGSGGNVRIDVDSELSVVSMNPVENRVITLALRDKADSDDLRRYATLDALQTKVDQSVLNSYADKTLVNSLLQTKQNVLTAGDGIRISNNVISSTVDTNVYVIVDELPQSDISDQKIYLLESTVDNETTYTEYRYKNGDWVEIGIKAPTIDMQLYLSKQEAAGIYQPIGSYITQQTLNQFDTTLRGDMANTYATLTYVNTELANYQLAGDYATTSDLTTLLNNIASIYATPSDLTSAIDTLRTWVTDNYVNKTEVHTPMLDSSQESDDIYTGNSSSTPSGSSGGSNGTTIIYNTVLVDTVLSSTSENPVLNKVIYEALRDIDRITVDSTITRDSTNPVENRAIAIALDSKADASDLTQYATLTDIQGKVNRIELDDYATVQSLNTGLLSKQNTLTAGDGILISNGTISATLDTQAFVIIEDLLDVAIPSENKIYLKEEENNGLYTYIEYKWRDGSWLRIGEKAPTVDLTPYLRIQDAASTYITENDADSRYQVKGNYQPTGNYLTVEDARSIYQPVGNYANLSEIDTRFSNYQLKGDYALTEDVDYLEHVVDQLYLKKGNYSTREEINSVLAALQLEIDNVYVKKIDVATPTDYEWSDGGYSSITLSTLNGTTPGTSEPSESSNRMITLTTTRYLELVDSNRIDPNTYYFTYEVENEPLGLGMFPINLT